jgi:hypothetical protein
LDWIGLVTIRDSPRWKFPAHGPCFPSSLEAPSFSVSSSSPRKFPFLASSPFLWFFSLQLSASSRASPFNIRCSLLSVASYFRLSHPSIFGSSDAYPDFSSIQNMDSDVEMLEQNQKSPPALVTSIAPPPPDSQQASPILDVNDSASIGPDVPSASDVAPKTNSDVKVKGKPASGKPKSSKARARSPSPSPPPAPPPPLQTIRLDIKLGGPDNYEVDVASLAKATGQRPVTPPPAVKRYESESDGEGAPESGMGSDGGGEKKGRKVRKMPYMRP